METNQNPKRRKTKTWVIIAWIIALFILAAIVEQIIVANRDTVHTKMRSTP